jgi:hypothetical protein
VRREPRRLPTTRLLAIAVFLAIAGCAATARAQQPDADVEIPVGPQPAPAASASAPPAAPAPPSPPASASPSEMDALRREMREERAQLGARIEALEAELTERKLGKPAEPAPPALDAPKAPATPLPWAPALGGSLPGRGAWGFGAYVQTQYEQHQSSEDQVSQDGTYLNQDRFLVRRGRLRLDAAWEWVELAMELDGNTEDGPVFGPKRINTSLVWRGRAWDGKIQSRGPREEEAPLLRLTGGLTGIPFGFELADSQRDRVFLERSTASQAFFPGEQDLGVVLTGGVGFFRYAIAAMNGDPIGDTASNPVGDPTHAKDYVARLGVDARPNSGLLVAGGVSTLYGTGFHAGAPATTPSLEWINTSQTGTIGPGEIVGVPAMAATPSQTFPRWAVGADLEVRFRTAIGWSMIYGEVSVATNLDRGLFIADPISTGYDLRELGGYAAFVQEILRYGLVGFRFDYYDPNADFLQSSGGQLLPVSQAIKTFSPLLGLQLPDRARFVFEYDLVRNLLGIAPSGVPVNLPDDHFAFRLQVQM